MENVIIYTDGASRGNPGRGGWAAVIITDNQVVELGGYKELTTNNQMELQGVIGALEHCVQKFKNDHIEVNSDSQYVLLGIQSWVHGWQKNGWVTKQNEAVKNKDEWQALLALSQQLKISWKKVKGHAGDLGNERADYIATSFADTQAADLFIGPKAGYYALESPRTFPCYASFVDQVLKYHSTWDECKQAIAGKKGVLYKKLLSASEESDWIKKNNLEDFIVS